MAVDVLPLKSSLATRSGDVYVRSGRARLDGDSGTLTFCAIQPAKMVRWLSAEIPNLRDPSVDSIRIRLEDGNGTQWYFDPADGSIVEVTDTDDWSAEYMPAYMLGSLDLWAAPSLTIHVHLIKTASDSDPRVSGVNVLIDMPTWEGALAQVLYDLGAFVSQIDPILLHSETLSSDRSVWKIGVPHSEHGYTLTSLVQVTVNGSHKSATLSDGVVTLTGPSAKAGDHVEIAVKYRPTITVRRVDEVTVLHSVPAWILRNLAVSGGLVGDSPDVLIGGYEVREQAAELRVTIQGAASAVRDALAMRLALKNAFGDGICIMLDSGRSVAGALDGIVEVVEAGDEKNLPMASATVMIPLSEFTYARQTRKQRADADSLLLDPTLTLGQYLQTRARIEFPLGDFAFSFTETSGFTNESPISGG